MSTLGALKKHVINPRDEDEYDYYCCYYYYYVIITILLVLIILEYLR